MKVKIQFSYSTSVVPPRCRNARKVLHHDGEMTVDIVELTSQEAPVAVRVKKERQTKVEGAWVDVKDSIDYRLFNNSLWTNCNMHGCSRSSHTSGRDDWGYQRPGKVVDMRTSGEFGSRVENYRLHLRLDSSDSKEEIERRLVNWASAWFILKGKPGMWSEAGEPRYVVMTFGLGRNHGGTALMLDSHYNSNISKDRYFSALHYKEARAEATATAKARGDTDNLPIKPNHGKIQVLIPAAIKCVPEEQAGEGDPFINQVEKLVVAFKNPAIAGIAAMGLALA